MDKCDELQEGCRLLLYNRCMQDPHPHTHTKKKKKRRHHEDLSRIIEASSL